jgi:septal ring factor EnvC (AmiA/AmiB activator)
MMQKNGCYNILKNPNLRVIVEASSSGFMNATSTQRAAEKESTTMPRPKGSKNKKTLSVSIPENVEEKIAAVEAEIAELGKTLKAKKAELKELVKAKEEAVRIAAEKKAEEDKAKILEAVEKSGKSIEVILEMLGK